MLSLNQVRREKYSREAAAAPRRHESWLARPATSNPVPSRDCIAALVGENQMVSEMRVG